jgi:CDP-4-dehydro-6-deoxyglucose reductase
MAPAPRFSARLIAADALTPLVRRLVFSREPAASMTFTPGQWVNLYLPIAGAAGPLRRAYSVASPPSDDGTFELAVTRVEGGPGSTFLHAMRVGDTVDADGPQGFFTRTPDFASPTLYVATGTGFTPLRSMLLAAVRAGATTPTHLILGTRHEEDLLYRSEIEALAAAHPWFRATFTLSQGSPSWTGARGYVQTHIAEALARLGAHGEPHVFACGLQRMVSAVRELVRKELGYPRERVHAERFD